MIPGDRESSFQFRGVFRTGLGLESSDSDLFLVRVRKFGGLKSSQRLDLEPVSALLELTEKSIPLSEGAGGVESLLKTDVVPDVGDGTGAWSDNDTGVWSGKDTGAWPG